MKLRLRMAGRWLILVAVWAVFGAAWGAAMPAAAEAPRESAFVPIAHGPTLQPYEFGELPAAADLSRLLDAPDESLDVPRVILALTRLMRPKADAATIRDEFHRHQRRLLRHTRQRILAGETGRDFVAAYFEHGVNLRRYTTERVRLPHDVLADRGGQPLELALTVALLSALIGRPATLLAEQADGSPGLWATAIEWPNAARIVVCVGGGGERCTSPVLFRTAIVQMIDHAIREAADAAELAAPQSPEFIAAMRQTVALLTALTAPDTGLAPTVARLSRLVQTLDAIADALPADDSEIAELRLAADNALEQAAKLGDDPELTYTLAERSFRAGDLARAEELYDRLPANWEPENRPHPLVRRAEIKIARGENRAALDMIVLAVGRQIGTPELWATGAGIAFKMGDEARCIELYESAERAGFHAAAMFRHRGKIRFRQAKETNDRATALELYVQSLANFRAAIAAAPGDIGGYLGLVSVLLDAPTGIEPRVADALAVLEAAKTAAERPALAWKLEAIIQRDWLGNRDAARAALQKYLEFEAGDAAAQAAFKELGGQ